MSFVVFVAVAVVVAVAVAVATPSFSLIKAPRIRERSLRRQMSLPRLGQALALR